MNKLMNASISNLPVFNMPEPNKNFFLPKLIMSYPGQDFPKPYHLYLTNSYGPEIIDVTMQITVLTARMSYRLRNADNTYSKAYAAIKEPGESYEAYCEYEARFRDSDPLVHEGYSYLVALREDKDDADFVLAQFDTYNILQQYFFKAMKAGQASIGKAVEFTIFDHGQNTTKSKAKLMYLKPQLFKQWRSIDLSKSELDDIGTLLDDSGKAVESYCKK